ncbi:tRNA (adenosine(37)-N6)-threonylcarbamoyltransferase complex transferase subunit TsaD [Candidatus Bealeia paramacronuclearis]|uniref:tRNA N6-adenosine threonylcarbamoyltransferase n=1 Tax=Candidatus Bealeia paramacronuclearis TaxID=1921001 RepID=A0ABZ2C1S5_9PROT|nr:tRNA (adenosine(37)-N6)-threonylcarbamoyltransferase complex transferase subunit TsaD [Candidatus Bealeia paramacronuclearis]
MRVLGIETSCDETSAAIVDDQMRILSLVVVSQLREHELYGGVVPEIAARAHLDLIERIVEKAFQDGNCSLQDIDAIAATGGPGLIGGVIVGTMYAKGLALSHSLPYVAVNHLEGHALTARLDPGVEFPYLLLLISGGHCQFLIVEELGLYHKLGATIDDAVGEAFDKTGKLIHLSYPAGPQIEHLAKRGDPLRFTLPRPLWKKPGCDFSFSGLKTAVRQTLQEISEKSDQDIADLCASFQKTVGDILCDRAQNAIEMALEKNPKIKDLVLAGGVAANGSLRLRLETVCQKSGLQLLCPPMSLCTDNAAMIAWVGLERFQRGLFTSLDFAPRPRWPLDEI